MPLTAAEENELLELEALESGLTPEEERELAELEAEEKAEGPTKFKAFAAGLGQGVTFGWSDEITSAIKGGLKKAYSIAGGEEVDFDEEYEKAVTEKRAELEKLAKQEPTASLAGEVSALLVPGMQVFKVAKGASKLAQAVIGAGTAGAVTGMETAGRSDELDAGNIAGGALVGGLLGGALIGGTVAAPILYRLATKHPEAVAAIASGGSYKAVLGARYGKKMFDWAKKKAKGDEVDTPTLEDFQKWNKESELRITKQREMDTLDDATTAVKDRSKSQAAEIKSQTKEATAYDKRTMAEKIKTEAAEKKAAIKAEKERKKALKDAAKKKEKEDKRKAESIAESIKYMEEGNKKALREHSEESADYVAGQSRALESGEEQIGKVIKKDADELHDAVESGKETIADTITKLHKDKVKAADALKKVKASPNQKKKMAIKKAEKRLKDITEELDTFTKPTKAKNDPFTRKPHKPKGK